MWQLRKLSTGENLNSPQPLPENFGPIFGLHGFKERLGDLSWVGLPDRGWFEVDVEEPTLTLEDKKKIIDDQIKHLLNETSPYVAVDNYNITKAERSDWLEYRRLLKEIQYQPGYPEDIYWPAKPSY